MRQWRLAFQSKITFAVLRAPFCHCNCVAATTSAGGPQCELLTEINWPEFIQQLRSIRWMRFGERYWYWSTWFSFHQLVACRRTWPSFDRHSVGVLQPIVRFCTFVAKCWLKNPFIIRSFITEAYRRWELVMWWRQRGNYYVQTVPPLPYIFDFMFPHCIELLIFSAHGAIVGEQTGGAKTILHNRKHIGLPCLLLFFFLSPPATTLPTANCDKSAPLSNFRWSGFPLWCDGPQNQISIKLI